MEIRELEGRALVSGRRRGSALVSVKAISFLGGVDPETGIITERDHDLEGESLKGRVLCFAAFHVVEEQDWTAVEGFNYGRRFKAV